MNKDIFQGKWRQLKGKLKAKWGKLTDDDLDVIEGNSEQLYAIMQERYGMQKDKVETEIDKLMRDADDRASLP